MGKYLVINGGSSSLKFSMYEMPNEELLINGYFEKYTLVDNVTSYLSTFNSSKNTYEFSNIARLLSKCVQEKKNGTASENWNKVLIIPVDATYDSSNLLVKLCHDFSMSSAKLVGGEDKVKLEVIYSSFKN